MQCVDLFPDQSQYSLQFEVWGWDYY